ncbi:hypothetical protein SteCoe_14866 [Stentor coeruleus]|uniref:Uncharacterized protein n=1 Tax=Stentor coeruleus TaxID=5963 RepID=A0A1R2C546_9CILI|nr:hypothetical protein SteCoe_14866 [Stentor coeruleus]
MFILLLISFGLASKPKVIQELGEIILFQSESLSLNLYDYFEGNYLKFSSNSTSLKLPGKPQLQSKEYIPYPFFKLSKPTKSSFLIWSFFDTTFLLDFHNTTLYLYTISKITQSLVIYNEYNINYTIEQVVSWSYNDLFRIFILTHDGMNRVFLLHPAQNFTTQLEMWDVRYFQDLKSCSIENSKFVPFLGKLYEDWGLVLIYDMSNPLKPQVYQVLQSLNNIPEERIMPIEIKAFPVPITNLSFVILDQNYGLRFYMHDAHMFQAYSKINLTHFGCLSTLDVFTNDFYEAINQGIIVFAVGACYGLVTVDYYSMLPMFFIKGMTNIGFLTGVKGLDVINDIYFIELKSNALMIVQDTINSQDSLYNLDLLSSIQGYSEYAKWKIIPSIDCYLYIRSDADGIKVYNLTFEIPNFNITQENGNQGVKIKATDECNESASITYYVKQLNSINTIEYLDEYKKSKYKNIIIQVIFEGFSQTIDFDVYEYVSGRNLSFSFKLIPTKYLVNITARDFDKVTYKERKYFNNICGHAIVADTFMALIGTNYISIVDKFSMKQRFEYIFESLTCFSLYYDSLFYSYLNNSKAHLAVFSESNTQIIRINTPCAQIQVTDKYLICSSLNFLRVYTIDSHIYTLFHTYTTAQILETNEYIKFIAASNIESQEYSSYLYILTSLYKILMINLDTLIPGNTLLTKSKTIIVINSYKIYATPLQLYILTSNTIEIYSHEMYFVKSIPFESSPLNAYLLKDFLFIQTENNDLVILDGLQTTLNSYFSEMTIHDSCVFSCAWIEDGQSMFGFLCIDDNFYQYFDIYESKCPGVYLDEPCLMVLPFDIVLIDPKTMNNGMYYVYGSVIVDNPYDKKSLNITFELIVYGQAVMIHQEDNFKNRSIDYNSGFSLDMLNVFSGNNMELTLMLNDNEMPPISTTVDPIYLLPNLFITSSYEDLDEKYTSLLSISNFPLIMASTESGKLVIFNGLEADYKQNNMTKFRSFNVSNYIGKNGVCNSIQYVSFKNYVSLIVASCHYTKYSNYYSKSINTVKSSYQNILVFWHLDQDSWDILQLDIISLDFEPQFLQVVTNNNVNFSVFLINSINKFEIPTYSNNFIKRISFSWAGQYVIQTDSEVINFYSLDLNYFYATSIDGIYQKNNLFIMVADYWYGVYILKVENGKSNIYATIPAYKNDPIISIGVVYKQMYTVSISGILVTYLLNIDILPKFSMKRYQFTTEDYIISSFPSSISFSSDFHGQYLTYPVVYGDNKLFYRIVDLSASFTSFLIRDIHFGDKENYGFQIFSYTSVFVGSDRIVFIKEKSEIVCYMISEYFLKVVDMNDEYYEDMYKQWGENKFKVSVKAKNNNNEVETDVIYLKIDRDQDDNHGSVSTPVWIFIAIAFGILFVLILSVLLVYKMIFRKKRNTVDHFEPVNIINKSILSSISG